MGKREYVSVKVVCGGLPVMDAVEKIVRAAPNCIERIRRRLTQMTRRKISDLIRDVECTEDAFTRRPGAGVGARESVVVA